MQKIVIDKNFIKKYESVTVMLENCECYKISTNDIIDVYCESELIDKHNREYRTNDGFLKIAARTSQTKECFLLHNSLSGPQRGQGLRARLEACGGGADMTSFSLNGKNGDMDIYVPYNPLEDIIHGCEIELSDCPSFEVDDKGNMIIAFGKSSKQPVRTDNNYADLITGWKAAFGEFSPKILKVNVQSIGTFGISEKTLKVSFKIRNKFSKKGFAELTFTDCENVSVDTCFPSDGKCEIVMSRMANGRIYVGFVGLEMDFFCASVSL